MPDTPDDSTAHVRDLRPDDYPRMSELFEVCFSRPRAERHWRWLYVDAPRPTNTFVLVVDGRVMSFIGRLWFDAWIDGRRALLARSGDLMADPSIRGGGYDGLFKERFNETQKDRDVSYSFPAEVSFKVFDRLGRKGLGTPMRRSGELPQWVRWHTGSAVHADAPRVPRLAGAAGALLMRARATIAARVRRRSAIVRVDPDGLDAWAAGFDDLAERSKDFAMAILVRDAAYVRWRWLQHPDGDWQVLVAPTGDGRSIDGYVVFGVRENQGRIVDLLAASDAAIRALVCAASGHLADQRVDRILFELSDPRPWAAKVLRRLGFLPRGRGPIVVASPKSEWVPQAVREVDSWYMTLADTDHI